MLNKEEYRDYCRRFRKVYSILENHSFPKESVALEICKLRNYYPERMLNIIVKAGFLKLKDDSCYSLLENAGNDLGLFKKGKFLLDGRYIFPVYDMLGNIIALIGWFPDSKKYVTTPSRLFSKSCQFYGMEQLGTTGLNRDYVLVEGIFDSLSVRSIGLPCISLMGISSDRPKVAMYSLFKSLLGIPDNDSEGRKVLNSDLWRLPSSGKYLKWTGDSSKDIDILINSYEEEDIKEMFISSFNSDKRIVTIKI